MIIELSENDIVLNNNASNGVWCLSPYPNHPHGCPNYRKRKNCPPFALPMNNVVQPPYYLVIEQFDILSHVKKMKKKHPQWTEKQCRNLLYWQKGVSKKLRNKAEKFIESTGKEYVILEVPEANGVDLFETCKNIGIELQMYPQDIIRKVMIVGKSKEKIS